MRNRYKYSTPSDGSEVQVITGNGYKKVQELTDLQLEYLFNEIVVELSERDPDYELFLQGQQDGNTADE